MPSREPELYKDKVEVSLDGRQIFYLFFGGAVVVGMVFVLGVLVGRRVEARGHVDKARTTAAADPLAALDRLEGTGGMAFRGALTGKESAAPVDKTIDDLEKARGKKTETKTEAKTDAKKSDEVKTEAKADVKKSDEKTEAKADVKKSDEKKSDEKTEAKKSDDKKSETKSDDKKADAKKQADDQPVTKPDTAKTDDKKSSDEKKDEAQRYTLQLSSFQDKAEAEAFLANVKSQGYTAQIKQAEVEGKGTFYRVRMGNYKSLDAASSAKSDFEKSSSKTASIMKL